MLRIFRKSVFVFRGYYAVKGLRDEIKILERIPENVNSHICQYRITEVFVNFTSNCIMQNFKLRKIQMKNFCISMYPVVHTWDIKSVSIH